jgi:hypothetical protein
VDLDATNPQTIDPEAIGGMDLDGIEPDRLRPRDFFIATRDDLQNAVRQASAEGRTLDTDSLNTIAERSLARQFGELKVLHNALGALPEPAAGRPPKAGEFTAAEKALMQEMAQSHGLRDEKALTALMVQARKGQAQMSKLAGQNPSAELLTESFKELSSAYMGAQTAIGDPKPKGNEDAPAVFCEMSMRLAGLTKDQAGTVNENLSNPLAQKVGGAFFLARDNASPAAQLRLTTTAVLMNAARTAAETQSQGNSVLDPLFFAPLDHPSEVPRGCLDTLSDMAPTAFSEADKALVKRVPPFSQEEWRLLQPIASRVERSCAGGVGKHTVPYWISAVGPELIAKQRAVGRDLNLGEIWEIATGNRMPRGVTEDNFGARLHQDVSERIAPGIVRSLNPRMEPMFVTAASESLVDTCASHFISPKQMKVLAQPGAVLTLSDVHRGMEMTGLEQYTPDNAYGLTKDYQRFASSGRSMTLDRGDGSGIDFSSLRVSPGENKPDNPIYQHIIENVRGLCGGNEAQTARVLQAFSQNPLLAISSFTRPFTGDNAPELPSSVKATRLPDGQVRVDITATADSPLDFKLQYTIGTDGSCKCTDFEMQRR